ncbi:hypothetical protein GGI15_002702 [Coemansia interrupta]|uniref:Amino acid transporter transmembrane domain-containing protein n=1 Tax=Coemansia interrupta TaxID=1126814 RepID=A0A9W8LJK6_9FUNG|nr:hypothetical protein GGI15_002702 [Coemansia interrupta]
MSIQSKQQQSQPLLGSPSATASGSNNNGDPVAAGEQGYGTVARSSPEDTPEVRNLTSSTEVFFHIFCILAGTGILQLPYALKEGGWAGIFYIVLVAFISTYCGNIVVKCLYCTPGMRLKSYSQIVEVAFGRSGRQVVRTLKDFNLLGVFGVYIVLAGININSLLAGTALDQLGVQFWIIASSLMVWAVIVLAREVHDVFLLSIFGTLTMVATVVIIVWLGLVDLEYQEVRPPTKLVDLKLAPISMASICFSFGGNLNWPDLEASMKSPKQWSRTLSLATAFTAFIYICIAAVGYGVYGDLVKSPIMLSLPPGIPVVVANAMMTAHVLLASPILLTSVFSEAERDLDFHSAALSPRRQWIYRAVFRSIVMLTLTLVAVFVSDFSKGVSILGAVAESMVIFVIPIVCYIKLFKDKRVFTRAEYIWCGIIVTIGLMCLIVGTSQAIANY